MVTKEQIARINQLTAISRQRALTAEEAAEREELRAAYRASFRASLTGQLDNTYIKNPDGSLEKLRKKS